MGLDEGVASDVCACNEPHAASASIGTMRYLSFILSELTSKILAGYQAELLIGLRCRCWARAWSRTHVGNLAEIGHRRGTTVDGRTRAGNRTETDLRRRTRVDRRCRRGNEALSFGSFDNSIRILDGVFAEKSG